MRNKKDMNIKEQSLDILNKIKVEQGVSKTYEADRNTAIVCINEIISVIKNISFNYDLNLDDELVYFNNVIEDIKHI